MPRVILDIPVLNPDQQAKFWKKVNKDGSVPNPKIYGNIGNCWEWTSREKLGYGMFSCNARSWRAHRLAFILSGGFLSEKMPFVLHECDNPKCVRASHLRAGNDKENATDRESRQRNKPEIGRASMISRPELRPFGKRNGAYTKPEMVRKGDNHGRAELTEDQVREIRRRVANGERINRIYQEYNVCKATVSHIVTRRNWRHI